MKTHCFTRELRDLQTDFLRPPVTVEPIRSKECRLWQVQATDVSFG